ncbi:DUF898 family protein [Escherichia coli]|nr:DUF898 family protein [Escherichia coli]
MKWMFRPIRLFFHGTGERYFLICVVNVLLTIITLGIYLPWALMKCKRYLYANMEVNGQRFSYGITGGNVFVSCLVFVFFLFRNLNDSVSRYAAYWLCFDFVTVGFAYIYGSKRTALSGLDD